MVIYKAENLVTGEVIEGGARDLAKVFGMTINAIYNAVSNEGCVKKGWIVYKENMVKDNAYRLPQELLEEWDRVTAPFKRLNRKKREKAGGA